MPSLLDQLIQTHGPELAREISRTLGVSEEKAAGVLPAAAPVLINRFQPDSPDESGSHAATSLDGVLGGAGQQLTDRIGAQLGVSPEQAARVIPMLVPVVLGFLLKRVGLGGGAVRLLISLVEKQGYGSLDELANRLVRSVSSATAKPDQPTPSIPTMLGRWAGKWFPSSDD